VLGTHARLVLEQAERHVDAMYDRERLRRLELTVLDAAGATQTPASVGSPT
jgi:hypothetical protein